MYQEDSLREILENNSSICKIWWMNIGVQETSAEKVESFFPKFNRKKQSIITATEQLCLYQAAYNDIVILRAKPMDEVLHCAKAAKGFLPMILYVEDAFENMSESIANDQALLSKIKTIIGNRPSLYMLTPFKITKHDYIISDILGIELCGNIPKGDIDINDKIIARQISNELGGNITKGYECYSIQDVQNAINNLYPKGIVVVKEYDGVSGQGLFIIRDIQSRNVFNVFLNHHKKEQKFRLLVEKWYSDCVNVNYQIYIGKNGEIMQFFPTIQLVNTGIYEGTDFQIEDYLDQVDIDEFLSFGKRLVEFLYKKGYYGNISIDAIKTKEEMFHLIEINARFSLSSYYLALMRKYSGKKVVIQYYNVRTANFSIHEFYEKFCKITDKSGVLILSFGENQFDEVGRIFLLFFAEKLEELKSMKSKVEDYIL